MQSYILCNQDLLVPLSLLCLPKDPIKTIIIYE